MENTELSFMVVCPYAYCFFKNWSMTPLFQGQIVSQADLVLEGLELNMQSNTEYKKKVWESRDLNGT